MMQQEKADDYVVATGIPHKVQDIVDYVFDKIGLSRFHLRLDEKQLRPEELNYLKGDASKIKQLGWEPKYSFERMLDEMIEYWTDNIERCIYV